MKGKGKAALAVRRIVGAMSGTSMDGVDLAVLETDGVSIFDVGETRFRPYAADERAVIRAALGHWPGSPETEAAAAVVEAAHLDALDGLEAECLGFHGQTLAHDPDAGRTHQAGSGARLADALGLPVVWDFRSSDMALGGQGAPLAPFYHWALARKAKATAPIAILNLGGVGNITWIDPLADSPDAPGALLAFDTGPANGPMDDAMQARGLGPYDKNGALAASGQAHASIVEDFLRQPYFFRVPPKSLDRLDFETLGAAVAELSDADALATLAEAAVATVHRAMEHMPTPPTALWVTGGGRWNATILQRLGAVLACPVSAIDAVGFDGDALEAQAFAFLAARVLNGLTTSAPGTTGVAAAVGGGQVSRP